MWALVETTLDTMAEDSLTLLEAVEEPQIFVVDLTTLCRNASPSLVAVGVRVAAPHMVGPRVRLLASRAAPVVVMKVAKAVL